MIFVFAEDGSLEIVAGLDEARRNYEGIDVESGVFHFFDDTGTYLEPRFTKPNKRGRLLGIFKWVESGEFDLVPSPGVGEDILVHLADTSEMEPNSWFKSLQEVKQFFTSRRSISPSI